MGSDIEGRLRCCAGISPAPGNGITKLNPAARELLKEAAGDIERLRLERDEWADIAGTATANLHLMRQSRGSEQDDGPHDAVLSE